MAQRRSRFVQQHSVERSLAAAKEGSFAAIGQLLEHYRNYLLRIAGKDLAKDLVCKVAPSDLVQETFIQAAEAFPKFVGATEAELRAWLRQILIHNLRDAEKRWRTTQKRAVSAEAPPAADSDGHVATEARSREPSPSKLLQTAEECERVQAAISRLSKQYRQVITLRTFDGHSFEEVGAQLGKTADAARQLWSRAVRALALELSGMFSHD